ncbi:hypothetical protein [Klebsiella pneumoniae]|uniref:hypothetical protein n=1 Tax=Klebsiella pneumoniae TaxID=573 RepID=UPI000E2BA5E2|nr:hypothetical protein [Klebsiella pneumoniae]MCM6306327.1 hypothetical protein [Klebsiella pneumoniae]MCR1012916.1 hypothetical protein [Klebsiella pneumoniae]MCR1027812.1 hypothetical protein [Klebsiella pneumoniae]MDX6869404.1 hypothetical protein [Klebsiella pneumoniae]SWA73534.1 Uncharacterised protein [Klebsiella pneumoniae]
MTKSTITREQAQKIIVAADEVITALAGTNEDVHPDDSKKMCELWDDLNDRHAPPVVVRELARMALAAMDSEPVAWTWNYREQWHVTNDERRAEFVAKDGDVAVLPLYRHAQSAQISEPVLPLQDKDLQGVIDALEHPAGINAAGKQVVRHALVEIQERRKADREPVAEVVSIYGDPEAFGEREIRPLVGIQQMPYGTKLYRHAQPAPVVSTDLFHTAASAIEDLLTTKDRAGAGVWFDLPFRLRSAANAQPAPVVPDDLSIFEAAIEECKKCDSIDEHAWNHGVLAVIAEYESCRAAMLAAAPQEVKGE